MMHGGARFSDAKAKCILKVMTGRQKGLRRMIRGSVDENAYIDCMAALKKLAAEYHSVRDSQFYLSGQRLEKFKRLFHSGVRGFIHDGRRYCGNRLKLRRLHSIAKPFTRERDALSPPDYFSDERIAVYTCIFGRYDAVTEPFCHPNNIDYYIITDQPVPEGSSWKSVDLSPFTDILKGKTNVEKNRWFKMHPHEVFQDYRYSVYVDGNVAPVTDFTEFVNRIEDAGVAMFWHKDDNCVYQEAHHIRYIVKNINIEQLEEHVAYLRSQGMPENYGMTNCNVIARDHSNESCRQLMDDWWREFMTHCRRDQMSFPYVVWKNGLQMSDIAKLGPNAYSADSLIVRMHEN